MGYAIANFNFEGAKKLGEIFYCGKNVSASDKDLVFWSSSDSNRNIDVEDEASRILDEEIVSEDFLLVGKYSVLDREIVIQTDLVSYNSCYFYFRGQDFVFSDNIFTTLRILNENNLEVIISSQKVRESIYFTRSLFDDTIFIDIKRIRAAHIFKLDLQEKIVSEREYNQLKFSEEIGNPKVAAMELYAIIDDLFTSCNSKSMFGIGLSGGLDSRVGAYFAKKHGLHLWPFFIGIEKNFLGMLRYDTKRSLEVAKALGIEKVHVINPLLTPLNRKLELDYLNNPIFGSNVAQTIDRNWEEFDVLINGMLGGEILGQFAFDGSKSSSQEIARDILTNLSMMPKYKYKPTLLTRIVSKIPMLKKVVLCNESIREEILTKEEVEGAFRRMAEWVDVQRENGLTTYNIMLKEFLMRFSGSSAVGYYKTLGGNKTSISVYLNPPVLRLIFRCDERTVQKRRIQSELIEMLGNLSRVKSQNYRVNVRGNKIFSKIEVIISIFERVIRGGSMVYPEWFSKQEISDIENEHKQESAIIHKVMPKHSAFRNYGINVIFYVLKIALLEKEFRVRVE